MKRILFPVLIISLFVSIAAVAQQGGMLLKDLTVYGEARLNRVQVASSISYTSNSANIIVGYNAAPSLTSGIQNIAIGNNALAGISTHNHNTVVGMGAFADGAGERNTIIGYNAGITNTSGSDNVFIGYKAGSGLNESNRLVVENSSSAEPLIYGDFSLDALTVNGTLSVRDLPEQASATKYVTYDGSFGFTTAVSGISGSGLWYDDSGITKNFENRIVEITPPSGALTTLTVSGTSSLDGSYTLTGDYYAGTGGYLYFKQGYWCLHSSLNTPYFQSSYISVSLIGTYNQVGGTGSATVSSAAGGDLGLTVHGAGEFTGLKSENVTIGNALLSATGEHLSITMIDPVDGVAFDLIVNGRSRLTVPRQGDYFATQMYRSVLIGAKNNTLSTASSIDVRLTPFDQTFIPCMTGTYGADLGVEHNLQVMNDIRADNAIYTHTLRSNSDVLAITANVKVELSAPLESSKSIQVASDVAFYFGASDVEGSWRIIRNGDNLEFQRLESLVWVKKGEMPPSAP